MKKKIDIFLNEQDLEITLEQFHFDRADKEKLEVLYKGVMTLVDAEIDFEVASGLFEEVEYDNYAVALVTLGSAIDELIELYLSHGLVLEAYMIDCIGLKLLSKGYVELVTEVEAVSGLKVTKLDFPGDKFPTSILTTICDYLEPENITISSEYMLHPLKSAGIILPLEKKTLNTHTINNVCDICSNCDNYSCALRKEKLKKDNKQAMNYGYMRIFGNRGEN